MTGRFPPFPRFIAHLMFRFWARRRRGRDSAAPRGRVGQASGRVGPVLEGRKTGRNPVCLVGREVSWWFYLPPGI